MDSTIPARRLILTCLSLACLAGLCAGSCERSGPDEGTDGDDAAVAAGTHRTLEAIRASGELRVLVRRSKADAVPREGSAQHDDIIRIEALADHLGVKTRLVPVRRRSELVDALREGRGDIVGTPLRHAEELQGIATTTPVRHERTVLVVGRTTHARKPKDAGKLQIHVRSGSSLRPALERFGREHKLKLNLVEVPGALTTEDVLFRVGTGQFQATLALSHRVEEYLSYRDDVWEAMVIRERVPLVLAVRAGAAELLDTVNGFLYEYALTRHRRYQYGGDLDEIRRRKVIRVAMLNNAIAYFIYRGQEVGYQFELAELLSRRLSLRLEIVVPDRPGDLLRLLAENRADLAVVTIMPGHSLAEKVAYSPPIDHADQVLVQPADEPPVTSLAQLMGRSIHVRRSSQYFATLQPLAMAIPGLTLVEAPEIHETEDLIGQVDRGEIPLTVANSALLGVEQTYRDGIRGTFVFARGKPLVFAMRKSSARLLERINRFVQEDCTGQRYQALHAKYFSQHKRMTEVRAESLGSSGAISPFDDLARRYGRQYGVDWRLILAQMYQESRFDPRAQSWAGARGLLQVMPQTGSELGVEDLWDPEQNVQAGVKYLAHLIARFEPVLPMRQRVRFALASYNAGLGHVRDARRLAHEQGFDPNRWFGHVERAIVLLEKPSYYRRARHGYCRGSEPRQYVSRIQTKYDAYARLMPAEGKE